jgi:hypothetical protein
MRVLVNLWTAATIFVSSMGLALPQVSVDLLTEVKNVDQTIAELQTYEGRFWAIGLNGDTLQPDGFQRFFAARDLNFRFFVRSMPRLSLGDSLAYQENQRELRSYRHRIIQEERLKVEQTARQIMIAEQLDAAVGFTADIVQPDQFIQFFGERGLEISYYVRSPSFNLGEPSAYEQNLQVLRDYAQKLKELDAASGQ